MAIINQLDLENLLQIDVTAEPDSTVTSYLVAAQAAAEAYCQRHFDYATTNVETFDGDGREAIIQVDRWPIDTVTTVVESGVTLTVDQDYILYTDRGWVMRTSGGARQARGWRDHLRGIVITYDGGYEAANPMEPIPSNDVDDIGPPAIGPDPDLNSRPAIRVMARVRSSGTVAPPTGVGASYPPS